MRKTHPKLKPNRTISCYLKICLLRVDRSFPTILQSVLFIVGQVSVGGSLFSKDPHATCRMVTKSWQVLNLM